MRRKHRREAGTVTDSRVEAGHHPPDVGTGDLGAEGYESTMSSQC